MALTPGTRLGPFEVVAPLGAGGMGEVYQARDIKLGREVALKVLPEAFTSDPHRLARFEREARILAALNHPNIAVIYGLEEADGVRILELELVPGLTLAERLSAGPLDTEECLAIFRQIAEALEAAHDRGIIHRDLKPANIKVTPEGKVKVLDFGLAKGSWIEHSSGDPSSSPTAALEGSAEGAILGTVTYMSPEQARGKAVDKRTDVWSFGCVLYEALAGRKAFPGDTVSDTIASILGGEPDWGALPRETPARIHALLRRCLQKDSSRRLRDVGDARLEIEEVLLESARTPSAIAAAVAAAMPARWPAWWRTWAIVIASAIAGGLVTAFALRSARPPQSEGRRLTRLTRLTNDPGFSDWPTWAPEGGLLAFASNRSGNFEVYVRRVEGGQEVNVTSDPGEDFQPAFSPDGKWIAFISTRSSRSGMIKIMGQVFTADFYAYGGDLWVAPALGGPAQRLASDANFPAWHPSGRTIAYVSGRENHRSILEVEAGGGTPKPLLPSESSTWEINRIKYSPSAAWLSLETGNQRILLLPTTGGRPRELFPPPIQTSNHAWDSSGRLYYLTREPRGGSRLGSVEVDEDRGEVRGGPQTVGLVTGFLRDLAVSRDGERLAASELASSLNLARLPLAPGGGGPAGPEEILHPGQVIDHNPTFSPDGRRLAFQSDRLGPAETWVLDLDSRRLERLRLPGEDARAVAPQWFPDGRQLLVSRPQPEGMSSLWQVAVDGSHAEKLELPVPRQVGRGVISPDGRTLLYHAPGGGFTQVFVLDLASRKNRQLTSAPGDTFDACWSPDGRSVAFSSNLGGSVQLWRIAASGGEPERLTSGYERMRHAFYSPDGRWIYVQPSHRNVYRLPAEGGALEAVTRFPESGLYLDEPAISPDGRSLAYSRSSGGSSLWLVTVSSKGGTAPHPP